MICSEFLHCSLGEFRALPREEQLVWRLFIQEKWRREHIQAQKAEEKRAAAARRRTLRM